MADANIPQTPDHAAQRRAAIAEIRQHLREVRRRAEAEERGVGGGYHMGVVNGAVMMAKKLGLIDVGDEERFQDASNAIFTPTKFDLIVREFDDDGLEDLG